VQDEERQRFEVLLEEIRGNVQMIAEGYVGLAQRMDRLDADIGFFRRETLERFDQVDLRLDRIERHVGLAGAGPKMPSTRPTDTRKASTNK
jgi:hypothetical protein